MRACKRSWGRSTDACEQQHTMALRRDGGVQARWILIRTWLVISRIALMCSAKRSGQRGRPKKSKSNGRNVVVHSRTDFSLSLSLSNHSRNRSQLPPNAGGSESSLHVERERERERDRGEQGATGASRETEGDTARPQLNAKMAFSQVFF
jgi:hypothetical protein